jgi:hypothetical protein
MTRFEGDWVGDPYAPSSRFTRGATIALPVGEELDIALSRAGHDQAARRREAVRAEIGDWILEGQPDLGKPETHDTSVGTGAALWAVVLEWAGQGVVGGLAWVATVALARRLADTLGRIRRREPNRILVSAGTARLLAIKAVLDAYEDAGPLGTQSIELPSTMGGRPPDVVAYSDEDEPWIVVLVDQAARWRAM